MQRRSVGTERHALVKNMDLDDIKIANLSLEDIRYIRSIEEKLGNDICLVAVERKNVLYVMEAKIAPNQWERTDRVYSEIDSLKTYFDDFEEAKASKSMLKGFLNSNKVKPGIKKRPIRIRQIVNTEARSEK